MKTKHKCILLICLLSPALSPAANPSLRDVLDSQSGNAIINVPKATYTLDLVSDLTPYTFSGKKDVTIEGNGSTIVCNKQSQAFYFNNCENVKFSNFKIEYNPPCCTQGVITSKSGTIWDVKIDKGYPIENISTKKIQVFDKSTRELKENFTTIYNTEAVTVTSDSTVRLSAVYSGIVETGDYVVLDVAATGNSRPHTIILQGCKNMEMDSITIYDSNCFSFFEMDCEHTHYFRCSTERKVGDPLYPNDRLRSGSADALHSKYATAGPIVEECTLGYTGDDCVAINGVFYPVYSSDESTKSIYMLSSVQSTSNVRIKKGDSLVCVNNDGTIRGRAVVAGVGYAPTPSSTQISTCIGKYSTIINSSTYIYGYKIVLTDWIANAAVGDMIYSDSRDGNGFKVINNNIGHNRSRGLLIKASNGLISGNKIERCAMSGIAIAPEFYWCEAGCSHDVEIAHNTITRCMYDATMAGSSQAAALTVVAQAPNGQLAPAGTFTGINIHDNIINSCPRPCVFLNAINGGYYYGNTITPDLTEARQHGSNFGIPSSVNEYAKNCINLSNHAPASVGLIKAGNINFYIDNNDILHIMGTDNHKCDISLNNLSGIKVTKFTVNTDSEILLSDISRGIYIMTISCGSSVLHKKIII